MIRVDRLVRWYGNTAAVHNLSFSVERGEIVGFLGPNGAGKSTTMKILTGFLAADSGTAEVCGIDVARDPVGVRARVGYLPESNPLYSDMSVARFLQFSAEIRQLDRAKQKTALDRVKTSCGLRDVMGKTISELSKGFRQRVGLAQALLHDPDLLILDEPTAGLDPNQVLEIRDLLLRLGKEKTVILSTHILQEVPAVCSRVIIIAKGAKVADAPIGDLLRRDGFVRLVCSGLTLSAAEHAVKEVPGAEVRSRASIDNRVRLEVAGPQGAEFGEALAAAIVAKGGRVSELSRQAETLEECFHRHTMGAAAPDLTGSAVKPVLARVGGGLS